MALTKENAPMFSNKTLVFLTIPIILDALLTIAAGMVDSAMVSSAGEAAVSAVSLVDTLNLLFVTVFSAAAIGGSVITSQYIGCGNRKSACESANQLLYLSTAIASVFMVVLACFREPLLRLIYGKLEADVFENASTYFFYVLLGYPFFAIGASAAAVLRAMGRNTQAVSITVFYNVLNVIGNAILIYGFHMGVAGAAISTTCSRVVFAVLGLLLASRKSLPAHFEKLLKFRVDFDMMRRVARIAVANGVENCLFHIGRILISGLLATFGTVAIAAYSVSYTLINIGWTITGAFGTVLLSVVGQCVGAGEPEQARICMKKMVGAATVVMLVMFGSVILLRHPLVRLFDFGPETLELAAYYTGFGALASILAIYSWSFVPANGFRAAGDVRFTVVFSACSMFALRVAPCFVINALFPSLGPLCIYIGMWADWFLRSIVNVWRFRSGKWLHKRLI